MAHKPTVDEILYYADFWLTLSEKAIRLADKGNAGEAESAALVAVKLAYNRYQTALQEYSRAETPSDNINQLMAIMESEVADLLEK